MPRTRRIPALAVACAVLLALTACSDETSDESTPITEPAPTDEAAPTADTSPPAVTSDDPTVEPETTEPDTGQPGIVSAFYGLDDAIRPGAGVLCPEASGAGVPLDGMPVVFGSEIDTDTLDTADFEVARDSGAVGEVMCVTMFPSLDLGEVRTALLIGQYGSDEDPPVTVRIVDELVTLDGSHNLEGSEIEVTPLQDGPSIVLASMLTADERAASVAQENQDSCVTDPAVQMLRVTWAGGITLPSGAEPSEADLGIYEVTVTNPDGSTSQVTPVGFADLGEGDNVHELCIDSTGRPSSVSAAPGSFTDPGDDLNPPTAADVSAVDS
jgi:hypothetical protein